MTHDPLPDDPLQRIQRRSGKAKHDDETVQEYVERVGTENDVAAEHVEPTRNCARSETNAGPLARRSRAACVAASPAGSWSAFSGSPDPTFSPKFIQNAAAGEEFPVYGDGSNVREWIYVEDNCRAIDRVLREGKTGEIYNIGSGEERTNLEVTEAILEAVDGADDQITFVEDRPGHDQRYALDTTKIEALGWEPRYTFDEGLEQAVAYYLE